jgi:heat shock protein HtpX
MNTLKVGILLIVLTALFVLIGRMIGGSGGAVVALLLAVILNLGSYWYSDKLVLKITGAHPLSEEEYPELHEMVRKLAQRANVPTPRLFLVDDPSPNAFATGRNPEHGVIAVNQGLLNLLEPQEVEGVLAHEMSHIKHRDTLTSAIVATLAGAIMVLADIGRFAAIFEGRNEERGNPLGFLLMVILGPIAAMMIQLAISRAREFEADRSGAYLTGSGRNLASALLKLEHGVEEVPGQVSPSTAHMFIVNPFAGMGSALLNLFMTHPPIQERVKRLEQIQAELDSQKRA